MGTNGIGKITTSGAITEFALPNNGNVNTGIAAGPDGNIWFTDYSSGKIGKITASGTITEFQIPTSLAAPVGIAAGPDGNLWFTEQNGNKIGKITPSGAITEYPVPSSSSFLEHIAAGPDGNLWFTEGNTNKIGQITTSGTITEFPLPTSNSGPVGITKGPDGNLWFTEFTGNKIGRVNLSSAPHKQLFVLLQGINTSLTTNGDLGTIPDFVTTKNGVPGIEPYLKAHGYGDAQFLAYSYLASNPANGHPFSYSCIDTFENSLQIDAIKLSNQIASFLSTQEKGTITDIYLIGHSLGGAVAFTYLTALAEGKVAPLPATAHLKGVITLDSPIGGVSGNTTFINATFALFKRYNIVLGLTGCKLLFDKQQMVSVFDLVKIFNTTSEPTSQGSHASILKAIFNGPALTNQAVAEAAAAMGTGVLDIGNALDFLYDPSSCRVGVNHVIPFTSSQWVEDEQGVSRVFGREFAAGGPCFAHILNLNHFQVYNNINVEGALTQFLNDEFPTALPPAPPGL